jgi:acyl-CoA thioesterase-1
MKAVRRAQRELVQILFIAVAPLVSHAEPRRPTHVACVGDSITFGYLASAGSDYPSVLQELVGDAVQVENFGHSGATMLKSGNLPYWDQPEFEAATDFVDQAGANAIVSVVILLGANDSKPVNWTPQGLPKNDAQFVADYEELVDHFAGLSTKPVVYVGLPLATGDEPCCMIDGTVIHDEQVPLIRTLAEERRLPLIDLNTPTLGHPEYFSDGVHPTDAGYAVLAELVRSGLNREPSVSLTSPADGATLSAPIELVAMTSTDTVSIAEVEFLHGETSLGKVTAEPFSLEWPAAPGNYVITARATDTTLASATSDPIEVTISDGSPGGSGSGSGAAAGAGGEDGTGGTAGTGALPAAGGAGNPAGGTSAGATSNPNPGAGTSDTDEGCGCRLVLSNHPSAGSVLSLLALPLLFVRRRWRRGAPSACPM